MKPTAEYTSRCALALRSGEITATEYRHGAIVEGWPKMFRGSKTRPLDKRGVIKNQSARSLIRAAFAAANAETDWYAMMTLTFRKRHEHSKDCLRAMLDYMWPGGASRWGVMWWQEYQARGVVHYHVLIDEDALKAALWGDEPEWKQKGRGKDARNVLGYIQGNRLGDQWCRIIGDWSDEAKAFNRGGIVEHLGHAERVWAYVAAYCQKEAQKKLPDDECPQGRWWWLSPAVEPIPISRGVVSVWQSDTPHRLVFDKQKLTKEVKTDEGTTRSSGSRNAEEGGGSGGDGRPKFVAGPISLGERADRNGREVKKMLANRAADSRGE